MQHFADKLLHCEECGAAFIFTVEEQRRQVADTGSVDEPSLCRTCRAPQKTAGRFSGHVKWFSQRKGYGFITQDNGRDVFVHHTGIKAEAQTSLEKGQPVTFEIENTPQGPQAVKVVLSATKPSPTTSRRLETS